MASFASISYSGLITACQPSEFLRDQRLVRRLAGLAFEGSLADAVVVHVAPAEGDTCVGLVLQHLHDAVPGEPSQTCEILASRALRPRLEGLDDDRGQGPDRSPALPCLMLPFVHALCPAVPEQRRVTAVAPPPARARPSRRRSLSLSQREGARSPRAGSGPP